MSQLLKSIPLLLSVVGATACSSMNGIPMDTPVEPVPFENKVSQAMNIAAQTDLTRPFEYAGRTTDSPLEDKEQAEKEQSLNTETSLGVVYLVGASKVLTGNLTGIFDIAGAKLTESWASTDGHPARYSRWIAAVPVSDYETPEEAKLAVKNAILEATFAEIKSYGLTIRTEKNTNDARGYEFERYYAVTETGKEIDLNMRNQTDLFHHNVEPMIKQNVDFGDGGFNAYAVGLRGLYIKSKIVFAMNHELFAHKDVVGDDKFSDFMKRVTARLPSGYMYYQAPFPSFMVGDKSFTFIDITKPSIYKSGEEYNFVKK